jgi:hypothetical protein
MDLSLSGPVPQGNLKMKSLCIFRRPAIARRQRRLRHDSDSDATSSPGPASLSADCLLSCVRVRLGKADTIMFYS